MLNHRILSVRCVQQSSAVHRTKKRFWWRVKLAVPGKNLYVKNVKKRNV